MNDWNNCSGSGLRAAFAFCGVGWLAPALADDGRFPAVPFTWREGAGFLAQWTGGTAGAPPSYQGRLVVNYPVLLTVLLILTIIAVLLVGVFLYYRFLRGPGSLEKRVEELEQAIRDLYRKQQEDLDGVLRLLHPGSGKGTPESADKPDLEKDTRVSRNS